MNHLKEESSPYLLQHKNNPVDWYPWGDEALRKSQSENKLMVISVGYAACHWCHVMEHESFEDAQVAEVMNTYYVSVKVDREERPDIDQIYMNVAMITTGHGGWPLNVIALPGGKPIFAGTYFPKQNWIKVLLYFADLFNKERDKLEEQAENITKGLHEVEHIPLFENERSIDAGILDKIWNSWKHRIDYEWGGKTGAPKFMMPNNYDFILRYFYQTKDELAGQAIKITLKKMAFGGLYDQVGGGFARYSVDEYWKVPHFEKMLYDNGQLMSVYAQAYRLTKRPLYKSVVNKTFEWMEREMTDLSGGIYSSLDADSEGVEGKFYCWTEEEIEEIINGDIPGADHKKLTLLRDNKFVKQLYNIEEDGNFEHGMNVLFRTHDHEFFMEEYKITTDEFHRAVSVLNDFLFEKRKSKIRPGTDDKILTEWNAIAIKGLAEAYKSFGEEKYLAKAKTITSFLLSHCKKEGNRIERNFKNGKSSINGFLQDYAFFIEALMAMHEITLDESYLHEALGFTEYVLAHFYNPSNGMFYITSDLDKPLVTRCMDSSDNVIPAGNSTMAKNLLLLSKYFGKDEFAKMSMGMLNNVLDSMIKTPSYFSNWAIVLDMHLHLDTEIVSTGNNALEMIKKVNANYLPHVLITGTLEESKLPLTKGRYVKDKTLIYLCENKTCGLPSEDAEEALKKLR